LTKRLLDWTLNQAMTDPGLTLQFKREIVRARKQRSKSSVERN
jgi:hypothetical protein